MAVTRINRAIESAGFGQRCTIGVLLVGSFLVAGCGPSHVEPADTGARQCVQEYYQSLVEKNWQGAYALLDSTNQKRWTPQQFARLAQGYFGALQFEPRAVHVRACEERGAEATAHVVLTGQTASGAHRHKDAVRMRRGATGWRVVLPPSFGRTKQG